MKVKSIQFVTPVDLPGKGAASSASSVGFDIEFSPQGRLFRFTSLKSGGVYIVPAENVRGFAPLPEVAAPAPKTEKQSKAAA